MGSSKAPLHGGLAVAISKDMISAEEWREEKGTDQ